MKKREKRQFIYDADVALHNEIYRASGNVIIAEIMQRYMPEIQRIQRVNMTWADRQVPTPGRDEEDSEGTEST